MAQNVELRQQVTTPSAPVSGVCKIYTDSNKNLNIIDASGKTYKAGGTLASTIRPANILCSTLNIPVLSSGISTNVIVPLSGTLINPNEVIVGFLNNKVHPSYITGFKITPSTLSGIVIDPRNSAGTEGSNLNYFRPSLLSPGYLLYLNTDYTKAIRFCGPVPTAEIYGQNGENMIVGGFSYSDFSPGPLIGYYSSSTNGVFQLDKHVQLNSAWLDGTGNAVFSFTNWDTGNTALSIKVGFYE